MMKSTDYDIVDFHSHILPGADHGSDSLNVSVTQLNLAKSAGVTRIIVTPHFYPHIHTVEDFLKRRNSAFKCLKKSLKSEMAEIRLGAEVLLCENLDKMKSVEELCIFGTNTILVELPFSDHSDIHVDAVSGILKNGLDVVLAHADRYDKYDIEKYINLGVKLQLNASSLAKLVKSPHLFDWLQRDLVVALGSDIHGKDKKAYKNFLKAKSKLSDSISYVRDMSDKIWNDSKEFI